MMLDELIEILQDVRKERGNKEIKLTFIDNEYTYEARCIHTIHEELDENTILIGSFVNGETGKGFYEKKTGISSAVN